MKRTLLIFCLLLAGSAFAGEWKPFVGISGLMEFPTNTNFSNPQKWITPYACYGSQLEAGVRHGKQECYFALYRSDSQHKTESELFTIDWTWNPEVRTTLYRNSSESRSDQRIRLGYRYWAMSDNSKLSLAFGAGLDAGRTKIRRYVQSTERATMYDWTVPAFSDTTYFDVRSDTDKTSAACGGVFINFAVAIEPATGVEVLAITQAQQDLTYFKYYQEYMRTLFLTTYLQLRYTFGN